jgi:hypothetical protein
MSRLSAKSVMRLLAFTMIVFTLAASESIAASPSVKLYASLQPERLGKSSTVVIGFEIATSKDVLPSPLTSFNVQLPAGMGLAGTTLGVDTCSAEALVHLGPSSCPPDAAMGLGSAVAEAAFGSEIVREPGQVSAFMTQARDNNTTVLYYFDGKVPVIAPLVFPSEFLSPGFSPISELETKLPLIPALPDTPDAAIVKMRVSLGPRHLTYYKRVGHRTVRYKPVGMAVPAVCPKGGFLFSAYLGFADGTHVSLEKRVACPSRH